MLPPTLVDLITSPLQETVTDAFAQSPTGTSVQSVAESLYGKHGHRQRHEGDDKEESSKVDKLLNKLHLKGTGDGSNSTEAAAYGAEERAIPSLESKQLEDVARCGRWGTRAPSEMFLQVYGHVLRTLDGHPLNGMVSPALIGSSGVVPLSIMSVIPDIIEHHADLIVRAEREIFLATNYWEASGAAQTIVDAFRELSKRTLARGGQPVVIKLMYDRGNPSQVINPHQGVDVKTYTGDKVKLPGPDEIPGCLLEVQNYHVPPVGTFHAKYMVVDRKIAILNSNNIQDRVNVEMMLHIEGPIVQSFYDLALLSWSNAMDPHLPLLAHPPAYSQTLSKGDFSFGAEHPVIGAKGDLDSKATQSRKILAEHHAAIQEPDAGQAMQKQKETYDDSNADEAERVDDQFTTSTAVNAHLNTGSKIAATDSNPAPNAVAFKPLVLHTPHDPVPMALVCRPPHGRPGHGDTWVPQDQAFLAAFRFAKQRVFIQTPTFNAKPVVEAAMEAVRRGILVEIYADLGFNDEGELLPFQGGTNEMVASKMYGELKEDQKHNLRIYWYTGKDQLTPLNAKDKSRNCHIKLMIVDEHLIIQGNGNQDTQSWFHSQEVNVMIDSPLLAAEIREGIDANQNTLYFGLVDPRDGVWRDKQGKELPGQKAPPKGPLKSLVGVKGAIQRVRGEGGF